MPEPIRCPACFSLNKPDRIRCHVCGKKLKDPTGEDKPVSPVILQRIMGGEVFSAVVGEAKAVPVAEPDLSVSGPTEVSVPVDEGEQTKQALAMISDRLGQVAEAKGQRFKPYSSSKPRKPLTSEAEKNVAHSLDSAVSAFREKKYDVSLDHLLKAIAKDDADPRSWLLLAESYLRMDKPFKAGVAFLRALDLHPRDPKAWLGLGRTLRTVGDSALAVEAIDRTIALRPTLAEAWSERGLAEESLSNLPEAVKSYSRALELKSDHKVARERHDALQTQLIDDLEISHTEPTTAAPPATDPPKAVGEGPVQENVEDEWEEFDDLAGTARTEEAPKPGPGDRPAKVRTYVDGLDESLGGGIPWGHVVLLEGAPGTMKSSIGFSILLHNAARNGLHGLYLSLEERASSLLKQMGSIGLPFHVDRGSLVVLDPQAAKGLLEGRDDWIRAFQDGLAAIKAERGLDLLVIDSLEALEVLARFQDRRREIFRLFEWLRDLDITSFVITERADFVIGGQVLQGRWDEDFLADGAIHLRQHLITDLEVQRRLRILKMRGTKHDSGYLALVLDEGHFRVTRAMSA
jgi:KaiC/GvpD/RAD55 family RecA-like ATPase